MRFLLMENYLTCAICSSTSFKDKIIEVSGMLERVGVITVKPDVYSHADGIELSEDDIKMLDNMHKQKINMADFVVIIDDKIGESVANEIEYAKAEGKIILYWSNITDGIEYLIQSHEILDEKRLRDYELDQIKKTFSLIQRDPNRNPLCSLIYSYDSSEYITEYTMIEEALRFSGAIYYEIFPRNLDYSDAHTKCITNSIYHDSICTQLAQSDYIIIIGDNDTPFVRSITDIYTAISGTENILTGNQDLANCMRGCSRCGLVLTYNLLVRGMDDPGEGIEDTGVPKRYMKAVLCKEKEEPKTPKDIVEPAPQETDNTEHDDDCCGQ